MTGSFFVKVWIALLEILSRRNTILNGPTSHCIQKLRRWRTQKSESHLNPTNVNASEAHLKGTVLSLLFLDLWAENSFPSNYVALKYLISLQFSFHSSQSNIVSTCYTRSKVMCDGHYVHASTIFSFLLICPTKWKRKHSAKFTFSGLRHNMKSHIILKLSFWSVQF